MSVSDFMKLNFEVYML